MKTAVEWLRKELETIPNYSAFYTNNYQWIDSIMNEAKEMEKEQMRNASCPYIGGWEDDEFENYYNETFKKTKQ
tara:strand:+ start:99 stop:320 length:222 start_codon:yes stop_codon:yes gene_type:complete